MTVLATLIGALFGCIIGPLLGIAWSNYLWRHGGSQKCLEKLRAEWDKAQGK